MHIPVLKKEILEALDVRSGETFVDMTLGGAGHVSAIQSNLNGEVTIIGFDLDKYAIERAKKALSGNKQPVHLIQANFSKINDSLDEIGVEKIDKVLFDLGQSSFQLDEGSRGFSFKAEGPLTMTYKADPIEADLTAAEIINSWSEEEIADVIYQYGEEKKSRKIAKAIVDAREDERIVTTDQLVKILRKVLGEKKGQRIDPVTKTFQALRIATNDELSNLKRAIDAAMRRLNVGGRIAIISFNSLEDRIVKNYFRDYVNGGSAKFINKKPIVASDSEVEKNPRSRSAKLRVIEKI